MNTWMAAINILWCMYMYIPEGINLRMVLGHTDVHLYSKLVAQDIWVKKEKISKNCKMPKNFQSASTNLLASISG